MTLIRNRPTPEGREVGEHLARWADAADKDQRVRFPNMMERCASCAFRAGTLPNGCDETVMDALKCVIEGHDFMCHQSKGNSDPCMGWLLLVSRLKKFGKAPWNYSLDDYTPEERSALNGREQP